MPNRVILHLPDEPVDPEQARTRAIRAAKSEGTIDDYDGYCRQWESFCNQYWNKFNIPKPQRVYDEGMFAIFGRQMELSSSEDSNRMELFRSAILKAQRAQKKYLDREERVWAKDQRRIRRVHQSESPYSEGETATVSPR